MSKSDSTTIRRQSKKNSYKPEQRKRKPKQPCVRSSQPPGVGTHNGLLLKCDADNCYAFFENTDDAIRASFDINAELFRHNDEFSLSEQIYLSVGIDFGRVLLVGDVEFFGDPVNTASKLGEDLAIKAETLVTKRAMERSELTIPETAERMVAHISDIEIKYVRLPMTALERDELE